MSKSLERFYKTLKKEYLLKALEEDEDKKTKKLVARLIKAYEKVEDRSERMADKLEQLIVKLSDVRKQVSKEMRGKKTAAEARKQLQDLNKLINQLKKYLDANNFSKVVDTYLHLKKVKLGRIPKDKRDALIKLIDKLQASLERNIIVPLDKILSAVEQVIK